MHNLIVVNPGHFHAALSLRERHPKLSDEVWVYSEAGPDLDRFLAIVESFNRRAVNPTRWNLHVYRGADYLEKLLAERRGEVAIVAGKNHTKLDTIGRLHAAGLSVLGDKPWLIEPAQLGALRDIVATPPLARDIMTERQEIANRLQRALASNKEVFGEFRCDGNASAIDIKSVHHLLKLVNGAPLVRPPWYFDIAVQGEGITDVTTHLVDLAQWLVGDDRPWSFARDVSALSARQWPTEVPLAVFRQVTKLDDFPPALSAHVREGSLHYRCNALLGYRLCGVPVRIEALWDLIEPQGGGDLHRAVLRGSEADLIVDQGPATGYLTALEVHPLRGGQAYAKVLARTIESLQGEFPGLAAQPDGSAFRVLIPAALRTTHEQHFAIVLEAFLRDIESGHLAESVGAGLVCRYALLARAAELSRAAA